MERLTREAYYMGMATLTAKRGSCGRAQVGCVIIRDGRLICSGYNGPLKHDCDKRCDLEKPCINAIHAEANAIAFAAKNGIRLKGSTMFITFSPCTKCAELIIQSGISKVVYLTEFRDNTGLLLLNNNNILTEKYNGEQV